MDTSDDLDYSTLSAGLVWEIRRTAKAAHARGLLTTTKWLLDLLRGISDRIKAQRAPAPAPTPPEDELREAEMFNLARLAVDEKQHSRAAILLENAKSAKGVFLRIYCKYIDSEKRAMREWHSLDNKRQQPPKPANNQLADLFGMVEDVSDPWLLFLKALILYRLARFDEAIDCILLSIAEVPWNWSAWVLLVDCVHDHKSLDSILSRLPIPIEHPMVQIFIVRMMNALGTFGNDELATCEALLDDGMFPKAIWIKAQRALGLFSSHKHDLAEKQFDEIMIMDPYRLDDLEVLADILYTNENKEKLARLSQYYLVLAKNRPETCYLLGCHYSLRSEHEKAAKYFRRAVELDRTFTPAWTMMGIEYLEMENPHAGIECFRRSIDVNPKDYRAWSNLGKAYSTLSMHPFALYYTTRALRLRPNEAESWEELGNVWDLSGKPDTAVACFKKALDSEAPHPLQVYLRLAQLLSGDDPNQATFYAEEAARVGIARHTPIEQYAKALVAVAEYHITRPTGDWSKARDYASRVAGSMAVDDSLRRRAVELGDLVRTKLSMRGMVL